MKILFIYKLIFRSQRKPRDKSPIWYYSPTSLLFCWVLGGGRRRVFIFIFQPLQRCFRVSRPPPSSVTATTTTCSGKRPNVQIISFISCLLLKWFSMLVFKRIFLQFEFSEEDLGQLPPPPHAEEGEPM